MEHTNRILLVDDDEFNMKILREDLEFYGYQVVEACDGKIACDILEKDANFDVILLDRMMPKMNGMEVLEVIKHDQRTKNIPVIMQTAAASKSQIQEGIDSGAFYYLTKPYDVKVMLSVIKNAILDSKKRQSFDKSTSIASTNQFMQSRNFVFRTIAEAKILSTIIANLCYEPETAIAGITELMLNAIEHGNLGLTFNEKTQLLMNNKLNSEIEKRLQNTLYIDKLAKLTFEKKDGLIEITIEDQGEGFDWKPYLEMPLERAELPNGRGIALAKMTSFDSIEYLGNGNKVVCIIKEK